MNIAATTSGARRRGDTRRLAMALLIPLAACGLQLIFWGVIQPFVWFLFYPAVYFSSWIGGRRGGMLATLLAVALVWYFFLPPRFSFAIASPFAMVSMAMFVGMGFLFSHFHERLRQAVQFSAEARFRGLFEQAAVGLAQVGLDGRFLRINQRLCDLLGYSREELLTKSFQDLTHPADLDADLALARRVLAGELRTYTLETRFRRKDQAFVSAQLTVSLVRDAAGDPEHFISVIEDLTVRQRAEAATAQLAAIVQFSDDAIIGLTLDGTITTWNAGAQKVFGYAADEMVGGPVAKLIPPGHPDEERELRTRIQGGESVQHYDTERRKKDGGLIVVSVTLSPIKDAGGAVTGVSKVARDITERQQAAATLRDSEQRFRTLVETAPEAIFIQTAGQFAYANAAALRLFGARRPGELLGRPVVDRFHPDFRAQVAERIRQLNEEQQAVTSADEVCLTLAGETRHANVCAVPFTYRDHPGALVFARDITERKQAEDKIQRTVAELERSNQELEHFAYVASHDLQEPLRMVSSYTQLLAQQYESRLDDKAKKYIHYAVDGAVRMQTLINDLLIYSRVSRHGHPLEPVDAHAVLGGAIRNLAASIQETHAIITSDALPMVRADASQLAQLFQNLLANAIKFQRDSQPRIHLSAREQAGQWVFGVQDNGIGIEAQYAERVFVIFQRLHTQAEYPGTGIGLAVCKRIVERHGGKIWFESQTGQGTTFFFTLPAVPPPPDEATQLVL